MFLRMSLAGVFLLGSVTAWGQSVSADLGSNSARFFYDTQATGQQAGRLDMEFSYLYTSSNNLLSAGMLVRNDNLDSPLVISVGGRGYFVSTSDPVLGSHSALVLSIGGELLVIPDTWGGLGIGVHYFTAPSIVSFMDAKSFTEYGGRLDYQITPQATVFVGYHHISFTTGSANTEIPVDSGLHFGIGIKF